MDISRRKVLEGCGLAMLGAVSVSPNLSRAQLTADNFDPSLPEEEFWKMVRMQFSFDESIVPMNAANLCPSFRAVTECLSKLTMDIDRDCSFSNRAKFHSREGCL